MYEKGQQESKSGKRTHCLAQTRVEILGRLELWLVSTEDYRVFWLNGMAGTGKSTIADSLVRYARAEGCLGAAFFCSRDFETARDINRIFPTIAFQLAHSIPLYKDKLIQLISGMASLPGSLEEQLNILILKPLKEVSGTFGRPYVVIIDALDECDSFRTRPLPVVQFLIMHIEDFRLARIKFFVSSRPANEIQLAFKQDQTALRRHDRLHLHDEPLTLVTRDIRAYTQSQLCQIKTEHSFDDPPFAFDDTDIDKIANRAGGLFIVAATLCRFIAGNNALYGSPRELLDCLPPQHTIVSDPVATQELDKVYLRILTDATQSSLQVSDRANLNPTLDYDTKADVLFVVGSIVLLFQPLGIRDLTILVRRTSPNSPTPIGELLKHLRSVILVPDDDDHPIRVFHASFEDYLTTPYRSHSFYVNLTVHHARLASCCFAVMRLLLTADDPCQIPRDMRGVQYSRIGNLDKIRTSSFPSALAYACSFWADHLVKAFLDEKSPLSFSQETFRELQTFATEHLLRWVNALAILGQLDRCIPMLAKIRRLLYFHHLDVEPFTILYDAERLVYQFYDTIRDHTLQVYISALPFAPRQSLL
ncbi:hypothetical protein BXZ70DRAFT_900107, partial [Cristinia sonorae]